VRPAGARSADANAWPESPTPSSAEPEPRANSHPKPRSNNSPTATNGVKTINLDDAGCPNLPSCDPLIHGVITRIDNDHLTAAFAKTLEPVLDTRLTAAGILG
jgi:hypothetical protein